MLTYKKFTQFCPDGITYIINIKLLVKNKFIIKKNIKIVLKIQDKCSNLILI